MENATFKRRLALRLGYPAGRHRLAGKNIGNANAGIIRETATYHETGLHAWDHHAWQTHSGHWSIRQLEEDIARGITALEAIIGKPVTCSAAAGWRADGRVVRAKEPFNLRYNSDCRGTTLFRPLLMPGQTGTPQIPVTLPTWDEVIGPAVQAQSFNTWIISRMLQDKGTPVYTIHAEVEGIVHQPLFEDLLVRARDAGITFVLWANCCRHRLSLCRWGKLYVDTSLAVKVGWGVNRQ